MFGLFGSKSGHPMADLESARQVLEDMPKNDAVKALMEIAAWIDSVRGDERIRLDKRYDVVRLLDETARPHEIKVLREYFTNGVNSPVLEKRQWNVLNEYYANLGEAYNGLLVGCHDGEKGASALRDLRQWIVARGINATVGRLKCAAVHYAPVETRIWEQLGAYYAEAETQKFLDEALELYPGAGAKYSIRHQCAGALLWWVSGTGSFKPLQIHLAERLIAHMCGSLTMGQEPGEDALYTFDLTLPRPPVRYNGAAEAHPNLRFIGHGAVSMLLDPLMEKLDHDAVPVEINLGGGYGADVVKEVTKRMSAGWLAEPPSRRNVRRTLDVNLRVVKGYAGLLDVANLAEGQAGDSVVWVAQDISATGFRCVLDVAQGVGLKIGSLIGFRPENVPNWGAGIVRRLRRDEDGNLDVGVEILASRTVRVKLGEDSGPVASADNFGVWLGVAGADAGESRVLLKPGSLDESRTLRMQMGGKPYMLAPQGVLEKTDDYDMVKYRVTE